MLKVPLTHPDLLAGLARSGHGSRVLLADGNYPHATAVATTALTVYLNLRPGVLTVRQVLESLVQVVPVESALVMETPPGLTVEVFDDYRALLSGLELRRIPRAGFYDAARGPDLALAVVTGDVQHYANLMLTVGTV